MHHSTALLILQHLAKNNLMDVNLNVFMTHRYPEVVHPDDVEDAFKSIVRHAGESQADLSFSRNFGIEVVVHGRLFEKLYKVIWTNQKLHPRGRTEGSFGKTPVKVADLPVLFVGSEKTQVRQIPLADRPPWPFRFLLELGGMIIVKTVEPRDMLLELRQFLNNYPQFEIRVDAKECPDGSYSLFTYWFQKLPRHLKRKNVNVPVKRK